MIFAVIGLFREAALTHDNALQVEVNEQLAQPFKRIVNAGFLRDGDGKPTGVLALIDVPTLAEAQAFLEASPYRRRGQFERVQVAAYDVEVGRLG